jgi:hypothetical protein
VRGTETSLVEAARVGEERGRAGKGGFVLGCATFGGEEGSGTFGGEKGSGCAELTEPL